MNVLWCIWKLHSNKLSKYFIMCKIKLELNVFPWYIHLFTCNWRDKDGEMMNAKHFLLLVKTKLTDCKFNSQWIYVFNKSIANSFKKGLTTACFCIFVKTGKRHVHSRSLNLCNLGTAQQFELRDSPSDSKLLQSYI